MRLWPSLGAAQEAIEGEGMRLAEGTDTPHMRAEE